jgi:hypothetical protein
MAANPFPGFTGRPGSYPVDLALGPAERQNRWVTGFRLVLAIPALLMSTALNGIGFVAAVFGWFAALFTGRMPHGLRNTVAFSLRYGAQTFGYIVLLTDRYPYAGPIASPASTAEPLTI